MIQKNWQELIKPVNPKVEQEVRALKQPWLWNRWNGALGQLWEMHAAYLAVFFARRRCDSHQN